MSEIISFLVKSISGLIKFHKMKMFLVFIFFIIFSFLLFPYNELSHWISGKISEVTRGKVMLRSESMGLTFASTGVAIAMKKVVLSTENLNDLKAQRLLISPSLGFGFSVKAEGFLRGEAQFSYGAGQKTKSGGKRQQLGLYLKNISLLDLVQVGTLQLPLKGFLSGEIKFGIDPQFKEELTGQVQLQIKKVSLRASNFPTAIGPLAIPEMNWSNVTMKGRMKKEKFIIEEFNLGSSQDNLFGKIKGDIELSLSRRFSPILGSYNFRLELQVKEPINKDLKLMLGFIDSFKVSEQGSTKVYRLRLKASRFDQPPEMSVLSKF